MTETPPGATSSWVDLSNEISSGLYRLETGGGYSGAVLQPASPFKPNPLPFANDQDYMSMLKEAQRETSCRSSARVSPITSTLVSQKTSPCMSPKSPPNSPRTEVADFSSEFRNVFINKMKENDPMTDFMWDWSSKPCVPKEWKSSCSSSQSSRTFSKQGRGEEGAPSRTPLSTLCTFLVTNLMSLLVGVGLGAYIYKRTTSPLKAL